MPGHVLGVQMPGVHPPGEAGGSWRAAQKQACWLGEVAAAAVRIGAPAQHRTTTGDYSATLEMLTAEDVGLTARQQLVTRKHCTKPCRLCLTAGRSRCPATSCWESAPCATATHRLLQQLLPLSSGSHSGLLACCLVHQQLLQPATQLRRGCCSGGGGTPGLHAGSCLLGVHLVLHLAADRCMPPSR
jgi:hypothetical protein